LPGKFISFEGGEGAGKSTQLRALAGALRERGIEVLMTREPGGSDGAEAIRSLLLSGDETRWSVRAEALLFAAARADHLEKTVEPALAAGRWVISDRFLDSSLAYQGGAGGLGLDEVRELHRIGSGGVLPDRTLILVLDEGSERARLRDGSAGDRIGGRASNYHAAVQFAFEQIARDEPQRVRLVDASGAEEQVTARLLDALSDLLQ
jgi:dTMP kinase